MRGTFLSAALLAAILGGCYTTGSVGYRATYASGGVYATTPDLVTVSPGVQVVADYDEPVFYTDGFYWRFYDGYWYRSGNYATGWSYYARPPSAVLRIDRPYAYVRYRPRGYVARSRPRYRPAEVISRDHRRDTRPEPVIRERRDNTYRVAPGRDTPPAARAPEVRDHRQPPPAAERRERNDRRERGDRNDRDDRNDRGDRRVRDHRD